MRGYGAASKGFTLLELLVVMAMIGILSTVAAWGSRQVIRDWRLKRAGHLLYEDLKAVQAKAEMSGGLTVNRGQLVTQRTFVVFEPTERRYAAFRWRDENVNGVPEAGEAREVWQKNLPQGISFAWQPGVNRRACSNNNSPPGAAVTFSAPDYSPCNDRPCIKFDQNGFSNMGPGAIYLSDGQQSLAITLTRPGHFTMCEWNGDRWL